MSWIHFKNHVLRWVFFQKGAPFHEFFFTSHLWSKELTFCSTSPLSTSFPNLFPCHAFSSHSSSRGFQCRPINSLLSLYSCGLSNNITTELCSLLYSHLLLDVHEMGYPLFHCFLHLFLPGFIIPLFSGKMILMYILALLLCDVQWLLQEVPEKTPSPPPHPWLLTLIFPHTVIDTAEKIFPCFLSEMFST